MNTIGALKQVIRTLAARQPVPGCTRALAPRDFDPPLSTRLLILQPTPFCNIDCDYCYLPHRNNPARMALQTIELAARRLVEDGLLGDELTVVWHAGEPLVLPPAYYEEAFATLARILGSRCDLGHSIQTNATLIDDRWCEFFTRHRVRIGVSIDGPAFIHDRHRRTRNGKGTHAAAMAGLAALRRHGIPYHAIAVVTAEALGYEDAIHAFFRENDIHEVGFNFDEAEGSHRESSLAGLDAAHRRFIERMLDHMQASHGQWQVRELANAFHLIRFGASSIHWRGETFPENGQTLPFAMISVAWNGDFSTFSPELLGQTSAEYDNFVLGNVAAGSYLQSSAGEPFQSMWQAINAGVAACRRNCAYFAYCGGGAPANKLYENGRFESTETLYCRSMIQRPFETVLTRLEQTTLKLRQAPQTPVRIRPEPRPGCNCAVGREKNP